MSVYEEIAKDWELWKALGEAYAATLGWKKAAEKYELAIQKAEAAAVSNQQRVALLEQLAGAWTQARQWDAADRGYERAIALANVSKMADGEVARVWAAKASTPTSGPPPSQVPTRRTGHGGRGLFQRSEKLHTTPPTCTPVYLLQEQARVHAKVGKLDDMAARPRRRGLRPASPWTWLRLERA